MVFCIRDFQSIIFSKNLHGLIFHKHIVLSVKLRKSERMNVSHKIPTGTGVCKLGFIVIELKLSYEPSALLRCRTLVSVDFPPRTGRRMHWILVM